MRALIQAWEDFWISRTIEVGRLKALRVGFFGLLGIDMMHLMVAKAYRYGAAGFNVPHFDSWETLFPIPDPVVHTVLYLVGGFLSLRVAAGIAVRSSLVMLTAVYGYTYFASLLDSYQHHYMVFWFLLLAWLVPFERCQDSKSGRIPAWGLSLFYAQMSLVYFFTAVAKLDEGWRSGWVFQTLPMPSWVDELAAGLATTFHYSTDQVFSAFAYTVLFWEFVAAAAFVIPRLRVFCCVTGPVFHVMVELINLKVKWFSLYMLVLYYLLLFPDLWYGRISSLLGNLFRPAIELWARVVEGGALRWSQRLVSLALVCAATVALCFTSVLPGIPGLMFALVFLICLSELLAKGGRRALPRLVLQLLFVALVVGVPRFSNTGYEYYRLKGGDLTMRGELEEAVSAYEKAIELNPGPNSRHAKLGDLFSRLGQSDDAEAMFRRALEMDSTQTRALRGMAKLMRRKGRFEEAERYEGQLKSIGRRTGKPPR